jgi:amino acid transporter
MATHLFIQILILLVFVVGVIILFRSKADVDFFQDELPSGKKTNSLMRIGFIAMVAMAIVYVFHQMEFDKVINVPFILSWMGIATSLKLGQKYLENKPADDQPKPPAL